MSTIDRQEITISDGLNEVIRFQVDVETIRGVVLIESTDGTTPRALFRKVMARRAPKSLVRRFIFVRQAE